MPKLDGVAATSLIRKFDQGTPIISMTSNSKPNEIMTYYNHGMFLNSTLKVQQKVDPGSRHERYPAKAIHKRGVARHARGTSFSEPATSDPQTRLFAQKQKHLMHLKVIQQMSRIPRPMGDANYDQALTIADPSSSSSSSTPPATSDNPGWVLNLGEGDEGRINPLAAMGLSDESYQTMVQNLISAESFMDMGGLGGGGGGGGGGELKRALEEDGDGGVEDGRGGKRSRFEVVE
jgi:osomolarity two-component system response regulator SKN7